MARGFSSQATKAEGGSIFDQADFFESDKELMTKIQETDFGFSGSRMPYFDSTDTLGSLEAMIPKDPGNLPQGVSTFGIWEYVAFLDDFFTNMWMQCSELGGMGLCWGLIISTCITRMAFMPI